VSSRGPLLTPCSAVRTTVEAALAGGAAFVVSLDRAHLLPLGEWRGIRIVEPRTLLAVLRRG
jgi:hypothetical protein